MAKKPFLAPGAVRVVTRFDNWERINRSIRRMNGQFTNAEGAVQRAHMAMAQHVAATQYRILDAAVKERATRWPDSNRSTRHLRTAVQSQGNTRGVGNWMRGYEVGIPSYLDSTPAAPYWRQVEEGSDAFVGRELLRAGRGVTFRGGTGLRDLTNIPGARGPRVRVERAIQGYRFLSDGASEARRRLRGGLAFETYRRELSAYGIEITRFPGATPGARATAMARYLTTR